MGKRSNFKRMKGDFYITPESAVLPLLPHLELQTSFYEPCAGDGALIASLEKYSHISLNPTDIEPKKTWITKKDALQIKQRDLDGVDKIITNPPWTRSILHPMIDLFSSLRPTWLLFDADWMHTKQASPHMEFCQKIVSVGRASWMGNGVSGKDNAAWYLFDKSSEGRREFCPRI